MNNETILFDNFIRFAFEEMKKPNWGFMEEHCLRNQKTFQEICNEKYNGDLDEALDKFFRNELDMWFWFSEMNETGMDLDIEYNFDNYLNRLSIDDLKNILELDYCLK